MQCAECTSPVVPPQRDPTVQPPLWANTATSGRDITSSCPKRGTDSSCPDTLCPLCSLAVPKLLRPHGTNGGGPHPRCNPQKARGCAAPGAMQ
ncbi:uncharacterized protein LOC121112303 [Gallus gallus]|uniref:uncharacterized protein LOC121112303 n=1 Tax=Gallus gallus TaxID=9031 RepID=UPI001F01FAA8|nr:uncharacterized protein LOC121112303 [Gallus gallus]